MTEYILFYDKSDPYFEFSNFYKSKIIIDDKEYPTVEHYFQSQKFTKYPEYAEIIRSSNTPGIAKILGSQKTKFNYKWVQELKKIIKEHGAIIDEDWELKKDEIMYKGLFAKFTQNKKLKELLLSTEDKIIIENSGSRDMYWGNGIKNSTENVGKLGLLLMKLRNELK